MATARFDIDAQVRDLLCRTAHHLAGQPGYSSLTAEDLEQELALRLLLRRHLFRPARGNPMAFATIAVRSTVANFLRDHSLRTRTQTSLGAREPVAREAGPDNPQTNLRLDLATVLSRLPSALRQIAERLMTRNVAQAAADMGVCRSTLYRRLRQLRRRFEQAGLNQYLRDS